MEVHHETKLQSSKLGGLLTAQVRKRGTKQLADLPHKQASMVFNPSDPYSSAMDNIPLKDLFPNVKVRKRSQERKVESSDTPPRSVESQASIRSKLRESLTAALRTVGGVDFDQSPDQEWKSESQLGDQRYYPDERSTDQVAGAGQVKIEERGADTIDSVLGLPGGSSDSEWKYDINRSRFMGDGSWFSSNGTMYPSHMEESPYKKLKVEAENTDREDLNRQQASQQAEKVALDIEAELFRHFGGVNRKYKEKARSLLFNLKDRSNPDLRTRVLSGEISPQNLCTMNAEQLASKELSQWRIAKAEEFAHMVVLTDADAEQRRLVKKTHKGEFEVQVEKDDVIAEVATGAVRQGFALGTKQETEENSVEIPADSIFDDDLDSIMAEADTEGLDFSPIRDPVSIDSMSAADHAFDVSYDWDLDKDDKEAAEGMAKPSLQEEMDKDDRLPAIMSLDEYLGSKKDQERKSATKAEDVGIASGNTVMKMHSHLTETSYPSLTSSKERGPRKTTGSPKLKAPELGNTKNGSMSQKERKEHRKHEKLWEGSFQLSGSQISSVLAFYKSGDFVELQSWPKLVEIKGRVRLDALDKFLQELHLSRTRSIMVIACRVESGTSVTTMREAANQYEKGERVGYAEPAPGFELYLFPGGGASLKLLVEHGYLSANQILPEEEGTLVGCVVCRRTLIPSSTPQKTSSHYFNANRHALSGQLDSPTRPSETQWTGRASPSSKTSSIPFADSSSGMPLKLESEDQKALKFFANAQSGVSTPSVKVEDSVKTTTKSTPSSSQLLVLKPPGFDTVLPHSTQTPQDPRSGKFEAPPHWLQKDLNRDDDNSDDIPPGFGPKAMARVNPGIELSTVRNYDDDEDDDLPEFDFSTHSAVLPNFTVKSSEVSRESTSPLTPSLGLQASSFPQGPVSPQIPQMPQTSAGFSLQPARSNPFEQLNPSGHPSLFFSARPNLPPVHGSPGSVNSSQQSPQLIQQTQFHGLRPLPPPLPLPAQPPNIFAPRPHPCRDGSFVVRPPNVAQIPGPGALHAEQKETFHSNFIPPPQNQPILPRTFGEPPRPDRLPSVFQEQRTMADFSGVPTGSISQNTMTSMDAKHRNTMQANNLWEDDDDMPEWCPPPLLQEESRKGPLHPMPPLPPIETERPGLLKGPSEQGMALRTTVPQAMGAMGRGWHQMPSHSVPEMRKGPMQADGRGILQAPGPPLRYSSPRGVGILPAIRPEQFLAHRSVKSDCRSGEPREFKKVHQK